MRIQGTHEDPSKSKAGNFVPTTDDVDGLLKVIGIPSQIKELKRLGKFNDERGQPRILLLTLPRTRRTYGFGESC